MCLCDVYKLYHFRYIWIKKIRIAENSRDDHRGGFYDGATVHALSEVCMPNVHHLYYELPGSTRADT